MRSETLPASFDSRGPCVFSAMRTLSALVFLAALSASCGPEIDFPHAPPLEVPPSTTAPRWAAFTRGQLDSITFDAIDANGQPVQEVEVDLSGLPPGHDATLSTQPVPGSTSTRCTLHWTPATEDTGLYRAIFTAVNALRGGPDTTVVYTIDHVDDLPPVVTCPDTLHLVAGVPRDISVSADDPEGDPLFLFTPTSPLDTGTIRPVNPLAWSSTIQGSHASGTLRLRVNVAGVFSIQFTAQNHLHGFGTILLYAQDP